MSEKIKVIINGANGRMGSAAVKAVQADGELELVGQLTRNDNLASAIRSHQAQVVVDLTTAKSVWENTNVIIDANAHPVIGTTGLLPEDVEKLAKICASKKLGGIVAPNFSIGAVLMMHLAAKASKFFPRVEIVEYHHDKKLDAPSGTAVKTAALIAQARSYNIDKLDSVEILAGARGADYANIPIHSIRLPGLMANQEVLFGGQQETLSIRHDTISIEAFMPGIILSIKNAVKMDHLVYGLENILNI